jgi:hypothetical protein
MGRGQLGIADSEAPFPLRSSAHGVKSPLDRYKNSIRKPRQIKLHGNRLEETADKSLSPVSYVRGTKTFHYFFVWLVNLFARPGAV